MGEPYRVVEDVGENGRDDRQRARSENAGEEPADQQRLDVFRHGDCDHEDTEEEACADDGQSPAVQLRERCPSDRS